jgi:shikimate dehydrogenase
MSGERMLFIGVSTTGSSIFTLFPHWAEILGIEASIEGCDIPLGAEPDAVRRPVEQIAAEPAVLGALVTTHKVDIYRHAEDLFDELDENALLCREVSCISKRDGAVVGHAKDPITAGRALAEFLPVDHWVRGGHALCLGAGGAGTAIAVHLVRGEPAPKRLVVTDTDRGRLETLRDALASLATSTDVALESVASAVESDALLERLPPGSLVVNATGLGKDAPGSPLTGNAPFPERGVVWELNYRGDLQFLDQARRQQDARRLEVHDGWGYFLHGWSEVIAEVFHLELTGEQFARLAEAAAPQRPPTA